MKLIKTPALTCGFCRLTVPAGGTNMPERVLGKKPGETCSVCSVGRLVAQFETQHVCQPRIGGPPKPSPKLHHLVCSNCGLWYASAAHGDLNALLGSQASETFANPATLPEYCHQCSQTVSKYVISTGFLARQSKEGDPNALHLLYCHSCVLLLWKSPKRID